MNGQSSVENCKKPVEYHFNQYKSSIESVTKCILVESRAHSAATA